MCSPSQTPRPPSPSPAAGALSGAPKRGPVPAGTRPELIPGMRASVLQEAIKGYLSIAYAEKAIPEAAEQRIAAIAQLSPDAPIPTPLLERNDMNPNSFSLRLGQPLYPHMKLAVDVGPDAHGVDAPGDVGGAAGSEGTERGGHALLRVDAHDRHLHAPPGSPDEAWLATVRMSNKEIGEKIEAVWAEAGLPTFKEFLRQQLVAKRAGRGTGGRS